MIAAVFYFRIFQPGRSYSPIAIDFQESPADPFELVLANQSSSPQNKPDGPARSGPEPSKSTGRIAEPPVVTKNIPQAPAATKRVVMEVQAKREPAKPKPRIYTVKSGDSLWRIARDQLGDASRHLELAKLNEAVLGGDPDNLKPGQKIILPPK